MKIASSAPGRFTVEMSAREALICRAALREVLYGFTFPDFEPRMGCTRPEATSVLTSLPFRKKLTRCTCGVVRRQEGQYALVQILGRLEDGVAGTLIWLEQTGAHVIPTCTALN